MKKINIDISSELQKIKKKMILVFCIAGIMLVIGVVLVALILNNSEKSKIENSESIDVSIFDKNLSVDYNYLLGYTSKLTGKVTNNSEGKIEKLILTFYVLDESNKKLYKKDCFIDEIDVGVTKLFEISFEKYTDEKHVDVELAEVATEESFSVTDGLQILGSFIFVGGIGLIIITTIKYKRNKYSKCRILFNREFDNFIREQVEHNNLIAVYLNDLEIVSSGITEDSMKFFINNEDEKIYFIDYDKGELSVVDFDEIQDYEVIINGNVYKNRKSNNNWDQIINNWKNVNVYELMLVFKMKDFAMSDIIYNFEGVYFKDRGREIQRPSFDSLQKAIDILDKVKIPINDEEKKRWKCPYCGVLNSEESNKCFGCGANRK